MCSLETFNIKNRWNKDLNTELKQNTNFNNLSNDIKWKLKKSNDINFQPLNERIANNFDIDMKYYQEIKLLKKSNMSHFQKYFKRWLLYSNRKFKSDDRITFDFSFEKIFFLMMKKIFVIY